jgi:hypothetical protein
LGSLVIGPQAVEGNLVVSPGQSLQAGFAFNMSAQHPTTTVYFLNAKVTFQAQCATSAGGGTIVVPTPAPSQGYMLTKNGGGWVPTGSQSDPASYEGSIVVPNLCSGGKISLSNGGTFSALVEATDATDTLSVRWHYEANGSAGGWSATRTVGGQSGTFAIAGAVSGVVPQDPARPPLKQLPLTITNPNPWPIQVLEVATTVSTPGNPTCLPSWLTVGNYVYASGAGFTVAANSSVTAPSTLTLPVTLTDLFTVDQSPCQHKPFTVTFTGIATPVVH